MEFVFIWLGCMVATNIFVYISLLLINSTYKDRPDEMAKCMRGIDISALPVNLFVSSLLLAPFTVICALLLFMTAMSLFNFNRKG